MLPVFSRPQPGFSVRFRDTISTDWLQATQRGLCLSPMRQMQEGPVFQSYSEADAVIAFIQKQLRRGANPERSASHLSPCLIRPINERTCLHHPSSPPLWHNFCTNPTRSYTR